MADGTKGWGTLGGGSGRMHKFEPTGTQVPDRSSQEGHSGGRRDQTAKGGKSGVGSSEGATNKYHAGTQTPGQSSAMATNNNKFAEGGTTKMFGNRGSQRCEPGKSAC
jgi:hypothetical protein